MRAAFCAAVLFTVAGTGHHERQTIKTRAPPGSARAMTLHELETLQPPAGVGRNDARYDAALIPCSDETQARDSLNFLNAVAHAARMTDAGPLPPGPPCEGELISTTGYLRLAAAEPDGDDHLQLSETPDGGDCLIVEIPLPTLVDDEGAEEDAVEGARQAGSLVRALLGHQPNSAGSWLRPPVRVEVAGALFFDDSHVGGPARGKRGMRCPVLWELHPVVSMKRLIPADGVTHL